MTPITAGSCATLSDANVAMPEQLATQQRIGPLRNGNPRGNPNLAPRCGAKAKRTGCACRAPAMANGRCRMHGGKSTGPRTPQGLARLAAAHTTHGQHAQAGFGAELRASERYNWALARRLRLMLAADFYLRWLPRAFAARLMADEATELQPPARYAWTGNVPAADNTPCNGRRDARGRFAAAPRPALRGRKAERAQSRAEVEALAPWKAAIARARAIKRLLKYQARAARVAKRGQHPLQRGAERPGGVGARAGSIGGPDARFEESRQDLMQRGAVQSLASEDGVEGRGSLAKSGCVRRDADWAHVDNDLVQRGAVRSGVGDDGLGGRGSLVASRCARSGSDCARGDNDLMQRGAVLSGLGEDGAEGCGGLAVTGYARSSPDSARGDNDLMQRGTVRSGMGEGGVEGRDSVAMSEGARGDSNCARSDKLLMQRGAVWPGGGPFRRGLLGSTARVEPAADEPATGEASAYDLAADALAVQAQRMGAWTVVMAIRAAQQARGDCRPGVADALRRMAEDANRLLARCVPRAEVGAGIVRWHQFAGER